MVDRLLGEGFPWGILVVNVSGSMLIGFLVVLIGPEGRVRVGTAAFHFVTIGLLGGFTTFSTFSLQTLTLAQNGQWLHAGANVIASVAICLAGVWLGHTMGTAVGK